MNENKNNISSVNNLSNSNDTHSDRFNLSLNEEKSKSIKSHYNIRRQIPLCFIHANIKTKNTNHRSANFKSLLNPNINAGRCKKINSFLNHENLEKKKRSKSNNSRFPGLYSSFNNILIEYIPVPAKVSNIPKNQNIKIISKKIDANIDKKTFICMKYNKKKGVLFIKFRNIFYYNYYYYYFKGRSFYKKDPCGNYLPLEMVKIEETNDLWTKNLKEEEIKEYTIGDEENNEFYLYIRMYFRSVSPE
jgi:hypothetical protein